MPPVSKPHDPHFFKRTARKPGLVTGTRQVKLPRFEQPVHRYNIRPPVRLS